MAIFLCLALALTACQSTQPVGAQTGGKQPTGPASSAAATPGKAGPTDAASVTGPAVPTESPAPVQNSPDSSPGAKPPQSQAAKIQPTEMRTKLTHLSSLIGYTVLDENGNKLGTASDYIVNTCETYIIYILMEPAASLNIAPGNRVIIPFEAVTINSGVLDAQNKTIQLRLLPGQFSGAPVFPAGQQLVPTNWEGAVRDFWMKWVRIGMLSSGCGVTNPIYKDAYATQLLGVKLYDGNKTLLGTVQDAILEPESGKISFYIVKPAAGDGLVMVSLAVTNILNEALLPGGTFSLVFIVEPTALFLNAPRISSVEEADSFTLQAQMRQYWGK
jgi:sporulation protein YlmC with PRC-barrel domain